MAKVELRDCRKIGGAAPRGVFSGSFSRRGRADVAWIVRLVSTGAEGEERSTDVLRVARPDDLADLASLGLTLGEGKQLLAGLQREIVAAQARVHAARRPACRSCGTTCRLKDCRRHEIATLFGRVTVRLPRFRCAGCRTIVAGMEMKPGRLPRPVFLLGFDAGHGGSVPVRRRGDLAPVEAERPPQLSRVELEGLTPFRVAGEEPQGPGLEEEPAGRKAGPGLAHRECREQGGAGGAGRGGARPSSGVWPQAWGTGWPSRGGGSGSRSASSL